MTNPQYFQQQLKESSTDLYLVDLLIRDYSKLYLPLHVLHLELTDIVLGGGESDLQELRLCWWRDTLNSNDNSAHPLLEHLPAGHCRELLSTKAESHLKDIVGGIQTFDDFTNWSLSTRSTLFECLVTHHDTSNLDSAILRDIIKHYGISWNLVWLFQNLSYFRSRGVVLFPLDSLSLHGLDETTFCNEWDDRHKRLLTSLLDYCAQSIETCESLLDSLPSSSFKSVFLYSSLFSSYTNKFRVRLDHLSQGPLHLWQPLKQWSLYRALHSKRYK